MKIIDPFVMIKKEIELQSSAALEEFTKLFPCKKHNYFLPYLTKNKPYVLIKYQQVGATTSFLFKEHKIKKHIICASPKDFWDRWNRFKKMKIFL